jgi:hypothetical protein
MQARVKGRPGLAMLNESGITVAITIIQGRQFVPRQTASNSPPVVKLTHAAIVMGMFTQLWPAGCLGPSLRFSAGDENRFVSGLIAECTIWASHSAEMGRLW